MRRCLCLLLDPDRVTFPVATGFALVAVTVLLRFAPPDRALPVYGSSGIVVPALVGALLVWALALGHENRRNFQIEEAVVTQTVRAVSAAHATTVLLADRTGTLGDIYQFYPPVFPEALRSHGSPVAVAVLCTPAAVERYTPDAREQRMPTTTRCENVPPISPAPLRLQVIP